MARLSPSFRLFLARSGGMALIDIKRVVLFKCKRLRHGQWQ